MLKSDTVIDKCPRESSNGHAADACDLAMRRPPCQETARPDLGPARMIAYFAYGSNMDSLSLKAKGAAPAASRRAVLPGWRLRFDVEHFFRHEGGMGNIARTGDPADRTPGVLHLCADADLAALDRAEAYGVGYDRIEVEVIARDGPVRALTYVGMPDFLNAGCLPTRRYRNILVRGARAAGLDPAHVEWLEALTVMPETRSPPFVPPLRSAPILRHADLAGPGPLTALDGAVFSMERARARHEILKTWFGGRDVTLFLLRRLDTSDGRETMADVLEGRLRPDQRACLDANLHAFAEEYDYVGRFDYNSAPFG